MSEREPSLPVPSRRLEKVEGMSLSLVAEGDELVGRWVMGGSGQILGVLEGQVACRAELMVGPGAVVRADIEAHDLVIAGHVRGNVQVRGRLKITTTGRLEGDAEVGSLVVQEGGVHFGALRVYPDGVPEVPVEEITGLAVPDVLAVREGRFTKSIERARRMWSEIF